MNKAEAKRLAYATVAAQLTKFPPRVFKGPKPLADADQDLAGLALLELADELKRRSVVRPRQGKATGPNKEVAADLQILLGKLPVVVGDGDTAEAIDTFMDGVMEEACEGLEKAGIIAQVPAQELPMAERLHAIQRRYGDSFADALDAPMPAIANARTNFQAEAIRAVGGAS